MILRDPRYFVLNDAHEAVPVGIEEWGAWFERAARSDPDGRRVAYDQTPEYRVSTVFLGVDHRLAGEGPPLIFETMIFGQTSAAQERDGDVWRCSTWDEAVEQHKAALASLDQPPLMPKER